MERPIVNKYGEAIKLLNPNFNGVVSGNTEDEIVIDWNGEPEISKSDIQAKIIEIETAKAADKQAKIDLKASAKTKLMAGEPLTEEEADVMIGG
jgi:hypothetical protein